MLTDSDLQAIWLTAKLASIVTLILLVIGTPIAWRLSRTKAWWKGPVSAIVAMPLVLPPSVIGFYLLISMGPNGIIGQLTESLGLGRLPFTFWGLVIASTVHSMPFMIQPLQTAFDAVGERPLEVAATLRASALDTFFSVVVPLSLPGFFTASVLTFAHTVGEFGVVLMIGGNLPGETRVASVQIYDHVEALEYVAAHRLAAIMVIFSFLVLLALYKLRDRPWLEFIATIVVCGIVEYFTAYYLETVYDRRWWDYAGYFLNLHGRICAEGLLVFGLGGMAVVYGVAPLFDNLLHKVKRSALIALCVALVALFCVDQVYSHFYPNEGEGITDEVVYKVNDARVSPDGEAFV